MKKIILLTYALLSFTLSYAETEMNKFEVMRKIQEKLIQLNESVKFNETYHLQADPSSLLLQKPTFNVFNSISKKTHQLYYYNMAIDFYEPQTNDTYTFEYKVYIDHVQEVIVPMTTMPDQPVIGPISIN